MTIAWLGQTLTDAIEVANIALYLMGKGICQNCNGKGWLKCIRKEACTECGGSGERGDHPCRRCNGNGEVWCHECGGQGQVRCSSCQGTGREDAS